MGTGIVRVREDPPGYVMWSTTVDAPVTFVMTREQLEQHTKERYGREGMLELPARMGRVAGTGVSFYDEDLESVLLCNRAGPGETRLESWDEIVKRLDEQEATVTVTTTDGGRDMPEGTLTRAIAEDEFMRCAECAKNGSLTICPGCAHNMRAIDLLKRRVVMASDPAFEKVMALLTEWCQTPPSDYSEEYDESFRALASNLIVAVREAD